MMLLDISVRSVILIGTAIMACLAFTVVLFVVLYQRKIHAKNKSLQVLRDNLKNVEVDSVYGLIDAQIVERKRISRELHDNVGAIIATLRMQIDSASRSFSEDLDVFQELSRLAEKAGNETRSLSHQLFESHAGFSFSEAIEDMVESINSTGQMSVNVHGDANEIAGNEEGVQLFRIVQELLGNTLKHAKASQVSISFSVFEDSMNMIYEDDGRGFDPVKVKRGIGLSNIKDRVESMNGDFEFESILGKGSTFAVDLPI